MNTNLEKTEMKNNEVIKKDTSELISALVLNGDIKNMSAEMKVRYYNELCHSLNLNPVTKPFQIISFQGKEILYATKDATEQLRKLNGVSVIELNQEIKDGLCISKCKVQDNTGRFDIATGVVNIDKLSGNDKANAIMKSETKSKRRATLSICGLGILDESELDTMPVYKTSDITQVKTDPAKPSFSERAINYMNTLKDGKLLKETYEKTTTAETYKSLSKDEQEKIDKTYLDCLMLIETPGTVKEKIEGVFGEVEEVKAEDITDEPIYKNAKTKSKK